MKCKVVYSLVLLAFANNINCSTNKRLNIGDDCRLPKNKQGTCVNINDCEQALLDLDESGKWPQLCRYDIREPIVCCENEEKPPEKRIALRKCEEYSKWRVGRPPILSLNPTQIDLGKCIMSGVTLIVGGEKAKLGEFGHMARIGFEDGDSISWKCGGSLISENFVLTAAHCTRTHYGIDATWVVFNDFQNKKEPTRRKVVERIRYPQYIPRQTYHDIALLRLESPVVFSDYLRPACLAVESTVNSSSGIATGWGATTYKGQTSEDLLKVELPFISYNECLKTYGSDKGTVGLPQGLREDITICAGGVESGKDTCQGDSGGPIQIVLRQPDCMYSVVGVTSFGKNCGVLPGVYARVSYYVTWIESVVWANR